MIAFIPENDLEYALIEAATDPAAYKNFYRLLLESDLFVLGQVAPGGGLQIAQVRHKDRIHHPIFSAAVRLQDYAREHPKYFSMKGRDLFASTRGAHFLLNPGSPYGKEILAEEITKLLQMGAGFEQGPSPGKKLN